ncbi:hypothetical protein QE152_g19078 [Popillia japonica]|uniref:Uncharacterized protein n=1 Tax=Popillia japonica TaxID=7064 RepID=A0AAW1L3E8_POPJA
MAPLLAAGGLRRAFGDNSTVGPFTRCRWTAQSFRRQQHALRKGTLSYRCRHEEVGGGPWDNIGHQSRATVAIPRLLRIAGSAIQSGLPYDPGLRAQNPGGASPGFSGLRGVQYNPDYLTTRDCEHRTRVEQLSRSHGPSRREQRGQSHSYPHRERPSKSDSYSRQGTISIHRPIAVGVPHRSLLAPNLFFVCIPYLSKSPGVEFKIIFAVSWDEVGLPTDLAAAHPEFCR